MRIIKGYAPGRWGQIHFAQCGDGVPLVLLTRDALPDLPEPDATPAGTNVRLPLLLD
jgi:hypothetical protein